jgi:hypothetical protein
MYPQPSRSWAKGEAVRIYTAEFRKIAVAVQAFGCIEEAQAKLSENMLRFVWESDPSRPFLVGMCSVREASPDEAKVWREGREANIRGKRTLLPSLNPLVFLDPAE